MSRTILHQSSWAQTSTGSHIELHSSITDGEKPILMIGGVHGDEPEGVRLAQDLLAWLQKNNKITDLKSWMLIPCLNVDGYKNNSRTNANGVDLNRNFPSPDWSPEAKRSRYNPGRLPSSESEIKNLVKLIEKTKPNLIIHFHSWEPCVVYTGGAGRQSAEIIGQGTGYRVAEDIGYPTPGSLGQYGWLVHKTPVICIEAQEKSDLNSVWPIFGPGLQRLLRR